MLLLALAGCGPNLLPGQVGPVRYFADIQGEVPMRLLPPITDREGNIYVLYGAPDRTDTEVFVGPVEGNWSGGCPAHRGDFGVRGWVGASETRAWYAAGDALVQVDGRTGACRDVLDDDPLTGTELFFLGIVPFIDETPSQRTVSAIVGAGAGGPQLIEVDLDARLPLSADPLPFADPDGLEVLGTGAWIEERIGVFVVRVDGGHTALFVDRDGRIVTQVPVPWPQTAGRVLGYVQFAAGGTGMALLDDGSLLVLSTAAASVIGSGDLAPAGVQRWDGQLWLTGLSSDQPAVAPVGPDGSLGQSFQFTAAIEATSVLQGELSVRDERGAPAFLTTWQAPRSAIGRHPLLTPHPLDTYTTGSTGWLLAGPGYQGAIEPVSAVAFAPIGVSFP